MVDIGTRYENKVDRINTRQAKVNEWQAGLEYIDDNGGGSPTVDTLQGRIGKLGKHLERKEERLEGIAERIGERTGEIM